MHFTRTFYTSGAIKGRVSGVGTQTPFPKRSCRIMEIQYQTDSLDVADHNFRTFLGHLSEQAVHLVNGLEYFSVHQCH